MSETRVGRDWHSWPPMRADDGVPPAHPVLIRAGGHHYVATLVDGMWRINGAPASVVYGVEVWAEVGA